MLDFLFYITVILIIITKIPDLHSTLSRITHISQEKNPLGRYFMRKWGMKTGLILGTVIFFILTIISAVIVFLSNITILKILFIINGIFVSIMNLAISHQNYTGQSNIFIKILKKITGRYYQ